MKKYIPLMLLSLNLFGCTYDKNSELAQNSENHLETLETNLITSVEASETNSETNFKTNSGTIYSTNAKTNLEKTYPISTSKPIGFFSTSFENPAEGRAENITLAANLLNNTVVEPNMEFSYNDTIGPTTKENGFALGRIFVNGEEGKGYGGGVCQVSSTLYNAAIIANLEITERHPHSRKVTYVEENLDAATSYGVIDFRFKNNRNSPIVLKSFVEGETVTVMIEQV